MTPNWPGVERLQEAGAADRRLRAHMEMHLADKPTCDWQVEGNLSVDLFPIESQSVERPRFLIRQRRRSGDTPSEARPVREEWISAFFSREPPG